MQILTVLTALKKKNSVLEEALSQCFEDNTPLTDITFCQFGDNRQQTLNALCWYGGYVHHHAFYCL